MNINREQIQEGYIVIPCQAGYYIYKLAELESGFEYIAFDGSVRTCFSGIATYTAIVNTARCTTPEEIVALIEEQEKKNGRKGINDCAGQD